MYKLLYYKFKNRALLEQALTHSSLTTVNSNERLEHLGDALLGFIISEELFIRFPQASEGILTRLKISLVKNTTLAELSKQQGLLEHLRLGKGELRSGDRPQDSILAGAMESLIAAIYLDSKLSCCRESVLKVYSTMLDAINIDRINKDPKTELQEHLQSIKEKLPVYNTIKESGPDHDRSFTVSCTLENIKLSSSASAKTKSLAEQLAAGHVLAELHRM